MGKTPRSEDATAVGFTSSKRSLLLSTGEVLPIHCLYKKDGEPTQNIDEAEIGEVFYHDSIYRFSFSENDQLTVH